jgi:hypothetical protein
MGITTQKVNTAFAFLKDRTAEEKEFLITEETSHLDFVDDREKQEVLQKEELNKYEQKIIIL